MSNGLMGGIMLIGGFIVLLLGMKWQRNLKKYEFENRTDGGVIKFSSFDASQAHKYKKDGARLLTGAGGIISILGLLLLNS